MRQSCHAPDETSSATHVWLIPIYDRSVCATGMRRNCDLALLEYIHLEVFALVNVPYLCHRVFVQKLAQCKKMNRYAGICHR